VSVQETENSRTKTRNVCFAEEIKCGVSYSHIWQAYDNEFRTERRLQHYEKKETSQLILAITTPRKEMPWMTGIGLKTPHHSAYYVPHLKHFSPNAGKSK